MQRAGRHPRLALRPDLDYAEKAGISILANEEFFDLVPEAVVEEIRRVVGEGPVYFTFDADGLDPLYAPGTSTSEIGGFSTHEGAADASRSARPRHPDILGVDVVEVSPPLDPSGNTALVGATVIFELLCVVADRWTTCPLGSRP